MQARRELRHRGCGDHRRRSVMTTTDTSISCRSAATGLAIGFFALIAAGCGSYAGKGAAQGAGTGAIAGGQVDKKADAQKEAEFAKLREEIGDENFAGLEALADCKHADSLRAADKGRQSKNPNYALAGLWLEILNYADTGQEPKARELFPTLVKQDWNIETSTQAESKMREGTTALGNIREQYGRARVCVA
jgi:hypothetical protein